MHSRSAILAVALIGLGGTQLASASMYDEGQWVTTFMAGSQVIPHDNISPHVRTNVGDLGIAAIDRLQANDVFHSGPSFGIETGYLSQSNLEPFVRLTYSELNGRSAPIGAISPLDFGPPAPISADFDDMKSWALNLGTRYFLSDTGTLRTYVAGYLGAQRMDALRADLGFGAMPVTREEFLPRATRFNAGIEGGVSWAVSDQADLGLSIGAQYLDARHEVSDAFASLGIEDMRFRDSSWSVPVNLGVNLRF